MYPMGAMVARKAGGTEAGKTIYNLGREKRGTRPQKQKEVKK